MIYYPSMNFEANKGLGKDDLLLGMTIGQVGMG